MQADHNIYRSHFTYTRLIEAYVILYRLITIYTDRILLTQDWVKVKPTSSSTGWSQYIQVSFYLHNIDWSVHHPVQADHNIYRSHFTYTRLIEVYVIIYILITIYRDRILLTQYWLKRTSSCTGWSQYLQVAFYWYKINWSVRHPVQTDHNIYRSYFTNTILIEAYVILYRLITIYTGLILLTQDWLERTSSCTGWSQYIQVSFNLHKIDWSVHHPVQADHNIYRSHFIYTRLIEAYVILYRLITIYTIRILPTQDWLKRTSSCTGWSQYIQIAFYLHKIDWSIHHPVQADHNIYMSYFTDTLLIEAYIILYTLITIYTDRILLTQYWLKCTSSCTEWLKYIQIAFYLHHIDWRVHHPVQTD